jgi:hypothetical protein
MKLEKIALKSLSINAWKNMKTVIPASETRRESFCEAI